MLRRLSVLPRRSRVAMSFLQVLAIVLLLAKIWKTKSAAGKHLILCPCIRLHYTLVLATRDTTRHTVVRVTGLTVCRRAAASGGRPELRSLTASVGDETHSLVF